MPTLHEELERTGGLSLDPEEAIKRHFDFNRLRKGDRVVVLEDAQEKVEESGVGWLEIMENLIGTIADVIHVTPAFEIVDVRDEFGNVFELPFSAVRVVRQDDFDLLKGNDNEEARIAPLQESQVKKVVGGFVYDQPRSLVEIHKVIKFLKQPFDTLVRDMLADGDLNLTLTDEGEVAFTSA